MARATAKSLTLPAPHDDAGGVLDGYEVPDGCSWHHVAPQANRALKVSPKRPILLVGRHGLEPWTR